MKPTTIEFKNRILDVLNDNFQSAGKIATLSCINYYKCIDVLEELITEGKADKSQIVRGQRSVFKYRKIKEKADFNACPEPLESSMQEIHTERPYFVGEIDDER